MVASKPAPVNHSWSAEEWYYLKEVIETTPLECVAKRTLKSLMDDPSESGKSSKRRCIY